MIRRNNSNRPKPGRGWRRLDAGAVWEHTPSGTRIHMLGVCGFRDGSWVEHYSTAQLPRYMRAAQITGWNKRRALMLWALDNIKSRA